MGKRKIKIEIISSPATRQGKMSLMFIIAMPMLFYLGMSFLSGLYQSVPAGKTIIADILARPLLVLSMLAGHACGIGALITGLQALIKKGEKSIFVIISTIFGGLLMLFLTGEIIFSH